MKSSLIQKIIKKLSQKSTDSRFAILIHIKTVYILKKSNSALEPIENVAVLYEKGIKVFSASDCQLQHAIAPTFPLPSDQGDYLCPSGRCLWSDALVTKPETYVYATLPDQNSIAIIDLSRNIILEVLIVEKKFFCLLWLRYYPINQINACFIDNAFRKAAK